MRTIALVPIALLVACADGPPDDGILNAQRLELEVELRIGSINDPDEAFTYFEALEVAPDGRIYTMHEPELLIRIHSPGGQLLGTIGGEGEGPGEFSNLGRMGLTGDTLWVLDYGNYRFNFFNYSGELLGSMRVPVDLGGSPGRRPPRPRGLLADGSIFASPPAFSSEVAAGKMTTQVLVRMTASGEISDTIARYSLLDRSLIITTEEGFGFTTSQPFGDSDIIQISGYQPLIFRLERSAATEFASDSFRVTKRTIEGDTVFSRTYRYTAIPIDPAHVDSILQAIGQRFETIRFASAPTPELAMRLAREAMYLPAYHPPVTELVLGRDGTVWLQREDTGGETVDWLALDPNGDLIGVVAVPARFRVLAADRQHLWGMARDELDVPYIVRYGVRSPPRE